MDIKEYSLRNKICYKGTKVVVIGGGTGSSVILRGLKKYTDNITAIVTVADDGGSSGILREDLGMLPPGDIRSCILALADDESIMQQLFNYRFKEGRLKGQSFGNLFIAAMNSISDNFVEAIKNVRDVMAVKGTVLPVTLEDITLSAELENGQVIKGESLIPKTVRKKNTRIKRISINPSKVKALVYGIEAIMSADIIILGPGSLYTSIIPNLLVDNIEEALLKTKAKKFYISNVMTQPGETKGYTILDHINAIEEHLSNPKEKIIDYVILNNGNVPQIYLKKYIKKGAEQVKYNEDDLCKCKYEFIIDNYIEVKNNYIRHNADKIANSIFTTYLQDKKYIEVDI